MQNSSPETEVGLRLLRFVRACTFGEDLEEADGYKIAMILGSVLGLTCEEGELPSDDRRLLKLAASAVAFYREVRRIACGDFELDVREEAILRAVLDTIPRSGEAPS